MENDNQCLSEVENEKEVMKILSEPCNNTWYFILTALSKQLSKEPNNIKERASDYLRIGSCPNCGKAEVNSYMKYCDQCGQALQWDNK